MFIKILLFSIIQSFTEYIPVSSSLHLILLNNYLNLDKNSFVIITIIIQLSSSIATLFYYKNRILNSLLNFNKEKKCKKFFYNIFISFLPIVFFGLFLDRYIKIENKVIFSSFMLIIIGVIFLYIEKINKIKFNSIEDITYIVSFIIGFLQIFSLFPGVSRSGSTIIAGLLLGLSKNVSIEYSFILSVPTTISATLYSLYKNYNILLQLNIKIIFLSFIITLVLSIFFQKILIKFISNHSLKVFGVYRILLGIVIILLFHK